MIKAAFFDVDGTLYSHTLGKIPDSAKKALVALQKRGVLVFLATGRHLAEVDLLDMQNIPFDGYVVLNGQLAFDQNRRFLAGRAFSEASASALADLASQKILPISLVEAERFYVNFIDDAVIEAQKAISTPLPPVGTWKGAPLYGGVTFLKKGEEEKIRSLLPKELSLTRWNDFGLDIVETSLGKSAGLQAVGKAYGILPEEMIAFGDSENDLPMLEYAGIGVAMGNAEQEVKEAADYMTADQDADGIAKALLHFGLIEEAALA